MIELALLGPPRITLDGKPVTEFISSKALILFCYLALESRTHARETLAGLLWGEMPEDRAKSNLRQVLHNVQKLFPGYLVVTRKTVAFDAAQSCRVDVVAFRETLDQPEVGVAQLEGAVSLYRGDFLEGLFADSAPDLEDWLCGERERYQLLLLSALEKLADHYALLGEWERAADLARRVLNLEPWREASHRQLMLLLARQGEYNAALAQYETCRQILEEELGVAPMFETTALYERIQKARTTKRHNLLPAPGPFVGRQAELESLDRWVCDPDCRLITLVGPGGVGKTRLAQELVGRHAHGFLNGVRCVSLVPITKPEFIVTAIAAVSGVQLTGPTSPRGQLIAQLAEQELLLLLDGFEHLVTGAELVTDILRAAPEVKVVATSREKLNLQEEWVFAVDGLSTPPEEVHDAARVECYDAVKYFAQSARRQKADFALHGQQTAVARLCRILGGSPLGIELAAALLPVASCVQIVAEVEQNLDVLVTSRRDVPERHRSLRAVFDHSWQLLAADERVVFPLLSVFRGGFTLDAARKVVGADLQVLNGLVAKSLLRTVTTEDGVATRYEIHEILRQYAVEMLKRDPAVREKAQAAHIAYYVDLLQRQEERFTGGERQAALDAIEGDLGNVLVAWQRAIAYQDVEAIDRAISPLHRFYEARSRFQEGSDLFDLALEGLRPDATTEGQFVWGRLSAHGAGFQLRLGRVPESQRLAQQGVDVLRQREAGEPLALALNILGVTRLSAGDHSAAKDALQECLDIHRAMGSRREIIAPLANLGIACVRTGDYEIAKDVLEEGLAICYEEGIRQGVAEFLGNLGALHCTTGDLAAAQRYYEQALPVSEELGQEHLKARTLVNLGEIHVRQEKFEQALADCQAGVGLVRQKNDLRNLVRGLKWLGLAHRGLGDEAAARRCVREGLEFALEAKASPTTLGILVGGASLLLDGDRREVGIELLRIVARHPATDQSDRRYAVELLEGQGITLPDAAVCEEDRPLAEIAGVLLAELG